MTLQPLSSSALRFRSGSTSNLNSRRVPSSDPFRHKAVVFVLLLRSGGIGAADPVAAVDWVSPPAWIQSESQSAALRPGTSIAEGNTVITGAGGGASIRVDAERQLLISERSAWTWNGATDGGSGDIQQGEVHVYNTRSSRHLGREEGSGAGASASFRLHADGAWRLTLFSTPRRTSAEELRHHLERNGFPAALDAPVEGGEQLFKIVIAGFRVMEDADRAARSLKGKFPGVAEPRVERESSAPIAAAPAPELALIAQRAQKPVDNCAEWGAFGPAELARAHNALAPLSSDLRVSERRVDEAPAWWVFIPPRENRKAAIRKVNELKRRAVRDYFIVQEDSSMRFAISLGIYGSEEAAKSRLAQLVAQRVQSARIGRRGAATPKVFLQLRNLPEPATVQLASLRAGFPGTEVRQCAIEERQF